MREYYACNNIIYVHTYICIKIALLGHDYTKKLHWYTIESDNNYRKIITYCSTLTIKV